MINDNTALWKDNGLWITVHNSLHALTCVRAGVYSHRFYSCANRTISLHGRCYHYREYHDYHYQYHHYQYHDRCRLIKHSEEWFDIQIVVLWFWLLHFMPSMFAWLLSPYMIIDHFSNVFSWCPEQRRWTVSMEFIAGELGSPLVWFLFNTRNQSFIQLLNFVLVGKPSSRHEILCVCSSTTKAIYFLWRRWTSRDWEASFGALIKPTGAFWSVLGGMGIQTVDICCHRATLHTQTVYEIITQA